MCAVPSLLCFIVCLASFAGPLRSITPGARSVKIMLGPTSRIIICYYMDGTRVGPRQCVNVDHGRFILGINWDVHFKRETVKAAIRHSGVVQVVVGGHTGHGRSQTTIAPTCFLISLRLLFR